MTGTESTAFNQQAALAQFGEFALKSDDLDATLHQACRVVGNALDTRLVKVMELEGDGMTMLVRAGVGWKSGVVGKAIRDGATDGLSLEIRVRSQRLSLASASW